MSPYEEHTPEPPVEDATAFFGEPVELTSYVLVISDGNVTRAEGPMTEHQAMTRRNALWGNHDYEGETLSITMVQAGRWEES